MTGWGSGLRSKSISQVPLPVGCVHRVLLAAIPRARSELVIQTYIPGLFRRICPSMPSFTKQLGLGEI